MEPPENDNATMSKLKIKDYAKYFHRGKQSTRLRNGRKLKKFCEWANKTPQELIDEYENAKATNDLDAWEREKTNEILEFYNWFREEINSRTGKRYAINYANTETSGILAFHHQNTRALEGIMDSFAPVQMPTDEYRFSQDDLRKMFYYGDTAEKALISLAVCYGQGSKDFLKLEAQKLRDVVDDAKRRDSDFAKWIGKPREKTGIQPISFLTPEAMESLDAYLQLLEKKHRKLPKFLWCNSKPNKSISNEGLNKKLRRLVVKANIKTGDKRVRFHCLRKFTFSRLRRMDKDMAKIICAKSVSVSDMTYEEIEDQAEKVFRLAYKNIALNGNLMGKAKQKQDERIRELETAIVTLSRDLQASKTVTETLTQKLEKFEDRLDQISDFVAHNIEFGRYTEEEKDALRKKYKIREFSEEEKELMHTYQDMVNELQGDKGYLTPNEGKELDRRFGAYLKETKKKKGES